jgi:transcriptional antiterminator Rof (Rho-off)
MHAGWVQLLTAPQKRFNNTYTVEAQMVRVVESHNLEEFAVEYNYLVTLTLSQVKEVYAESSDDFLRKRKIAILEAQNRNIERFARQEQMRREREETYRKVEEFLDVARTVIRDATGADVTLELRTIHNGKAELMVKVDELPVFGDAITKLAWVTTKT